jgi:hypothetical protein
MKKKKYFRKIVIDNKEYDWLYCNDYYGGIVFLYDIEYDYHILKNEYIRKRRFLIKYDVDNIIITPVQVRELIINKTLLSKQKIRKIKIKKINKLNEK